MKLLTYICEKLNSMNTNKPVIYWTKVDEAPQLASYSLLPIFKSFTKHGEINIEVADISLAGRVLSAFPEYLNKNQRISDELAFLGNLAKDPQANIVKLPNISATVPQLKEAISELQKQGYKIPNFPDNPTNEKEKEIFEKYSKLTGSAVNPILREGNSDRRLAKAVKKFAQTHPHKLNKAWDANSASEVAYMNEGDFYANEKSITLNSDCKYSIELHTQKGTVLKLKENIDASSGEILSGSFMSKKHLLNFFETQIQDSYNKHLIFSLHLKGTMMKVSDPIIFGHAVKVFYKELFEKHQQTFAQLNINPNNGVSDIYSKIEKLEATKKAEIENDINKINAKRPAIMMVDSDAGITNFYSPNKVIVDASMPVIIRDGGKTWGPDGKLNQTKAVIPDRSYATFYAEVFDNCKKYGAFDPSTMGSVPNVGLMAMKAEEYGSHSTTFEIHENGTMKVVADGKVLMEHNVETGDIWRLSRVKDIAVKDWVRLAVERTRDSQTPAIFWLDKNRDHDAEVIKKVEKYLPLYDTKGLEISIFEPREAMRLSLERIREGKDTISVTGNIIRDYLTDLFPIIEIGTSARMLSIVPLLAGGGLFETGAGGSAPKHVEQFEKEGHLRWDSLGEYLAFGASLEMLYKKTNNPKINVMAQALDKGIEKYLNNDKTPSRNVGELDNRGSHFFLAQYWAEALAEQNENKELKNIFAPIAKKLIEKQEIILAEIAAAEGKPTNIGGYFHVDDHLAYSAMRPSKTLNSIIDSL